MSYARYEYKFTFGTAVRNFAVYSAFRIMRGPIQPEGSVAMLWRAEGFVSLPPSSLRLWNVWNLLSSWYRQLLQIDWGVLLHLFPTLLDGATLG